MTGAGSGSASPVTGDAARGGGGGRARQRRRHSVPSSPELPPQLSLGFYTDNVYFLKFTRPGFLRELPGRCGQRAPPHESLRRDPVFLRAPPWAVAARWLGPRLGLHPRKRRLEVTQDQVTPALGVVCFISSSAHLRRTKMWCAVPDHVLSVGCARKRNESMTVTSQCLESRLRLHGGAGP